MTTEHLLMNGFTVFQGTKTAIVIVLPISPELEECFCPAEVSSGSTEEVEAKGKRSDVDVDGCGSSKHVSAMGDNGGTWRSSPCPRPEESLVTWNIFSLLASTGTKIKRVHSELRKTLWGLNGHS